MLLMRLMEKQPWLAAVEEPLLDLFEFCDTPAHQNLVADLLNRTSQLTANAFGTAINHLALQVEDGWKLPPSKTWFVSSNNKENTDSSQEILNRLKSYDWKDLAWNRNQFFTRYRDVAGKLQVDDNVVIVDDFVGTGRSMEKTVNWFKQYAVENNLSISIYVCVIAGCVSGLTALKAKGITVEAVHRIKKGISDHFAGVALAQALLDMDLLEEKLAKNISSKNFLDYKFGYGKSEAMYYREGGNTPNNVFPIFWWRQMKSGARRTVMRRT